MALAETTRRQRGQAKAKVTKRLNEAKNLMLSDGNSKAVASAMEKVTELLSDLQLAHDCYLRTIVDEDEMLAEQDYYDLVANEVDTVAQEVQKYSESFDDAVSDVGSSVSHSSVQSASKSRAILAARQKSLQMLQEVELEELRCKQKKERIKLEAKLQEAKLQEQLISSQSSSQAVSPVNSRPESPAAVTELNPSAEEWSPRVPSPPPQPNPVLSESVNEQRLLNALQLPKIEVMTFDGDPLKYWAFVRTFENSVEKVTFDDDARLARLLQYCSGKAYQTIQCCCLMPSAEGYKRAKQLLKERFGDEYTITEAWIRKIMDSDTLKPSDGEGLRNLSDEVNCCKETLKIMGRISEMNNQTNLLKIVEKLPVYLQHRWRKEARSVRERTGQAPDIEWLAKFIQRAAEEVNDPVFGKAGTNPVKEKSSDPRKEKVSDRKKDFRPRNNFSVQVEREADTSQTNSPHVNCKLCKGNHSLFRCEQFKAMKPEDRLKWSRTNRLCDNCLLPSHRAAQCLKPTRCTVPGCGKKHTKFLHLLPQSEGHNVHTDAKPPQSEANTGVNCSLIGAGIGVKVGLPIVQVRVSAPGSLRSVSTFALLDTGSTNTFCSEELTKMLRVHGSREQLSLTTLEKEASVVNTEVVKLQITPTEAIGGQSILLPRVFTRRNLPISTNNIVTTQDLSQWPHLKDVLLPRQDPTSLKVLLLIGQDVPEAMVVHEMRMGKPGEPYAVKTPFGWVINGPMEQSRSKNKACVHFVQADTDLQQQVERFWKLEYSETVAETSTELSQNDKKAVNIWNETLRYEDSKCQYELAIPFKRIPPDLSYNKAMAEKRLASLKHRLNRDPDLLEKYKQEMNNLFSKGYAEAVSPEDEGNGIQWYLPHHPVFNPKKPEKLRIVFDCAAQYNGTSLNDQVFQGPDLTNKLVGVLLRFRQESVAVMADIEAMFHQVKVRPVDRDVLRFLWWPDGELHAKPIVYRMTVHLFGGVWSPSCCSYALRRTADDNQAEFDEATLDTVRRNFYVDDCLRSVATVGEAVELVHNLTQLLAKGGFRLTKWLSNEREVIQSIPEQDVAKSIQQSNFYSGDTPLPTERVLGVVWNIESDTLGYETNDRKKPLTRRGMLSVVSSIYDPLGFAGPFVLSAKRLIQELCRRSYGWDDPLPDDIEKSWNSWTNDLPKLANLKVERCIKPKDWGKVIDVELHHFADASNYAYGTVSYVRTVNSEGKISCNILMAKSKLAPVKEVTIPRLELSAATLAVKIDRQLRSELDIIIPEQNSIFWTDSMSVLNYINNDSKRFHTFVANRLSVIHAGSNRSQWRYINTLINPADQASRGLTADEIVKCKQWLNGPDFLSKPKQLWPEDPYIKRELNESDTEVRRTVQVYTVKPNLSDEDQTPDVINRIFNRRSSWYKLKMDVAWLLRVKAFLKCKVSKQPIPVMNEPVTVGELKDSELAIVKFIQQKSFPCEMKALYSQPLDNQQLKKSPLGRLDPKMNENGLIVVGGRLRQSRLTEDQKHPIILPKNHHVVNMIIQYHHEQSHHSGKEHVLSIIQRQFWIISARSVIRRMIRQCASCRKLNAKPLEQKMADLPSDRITCTYPFTYVGVDCFGPFMVKQGRSQVKRYGCLFTCLTTRAIHIEIIHSMDTDAFINALQRFISRRGQPELIRSDNGTNFVGAERELKQAISKWNQTKLSNFLRQKEISWKFNPPAASHMGGVWERMIRSVRNVLSNLLKEQSTSDEVLSTVMCQVEATVNSRPITKVSDDPKDAEPLTPNHLLLMQASTPLLLGEFDKRDTYTKRWRQVQYLTDIFWKRWIREYLPALQQRNKWTETSRNIKVDDIVIVTDEKTARCRWPLGRVLEVFPGPDGLVRSVKVKTAASELVRPIAKLCLLESSDGIIDV